MFDAQQDRWVEALDAINSIPPAQRSTDINNFRDRIYVRGTIEKAKRMAANGDVAGARQMLIRLYQDQSVQTDEKRQAAFVLFKDLNDPQDALAVTRDTYQRGGPYSIKAGADYASLLLLQGPGHEDEAAAVMAQVNASGRVTSANREDVTPVNITLAIRQADKLRERGYYTQAWDQITQLLNDNPDNTDLLLCAGRIYASSGRTKEAMENFDKAYQQDSGNIDVIRGVVSGAILAHEYSQASDYLEKGMEADPQNPWLFYLKAQIAQARGLNGEAIEALKQARALNLAKGGPDSVTTPASAVPAGTSGGQAPTPLTPSGSSTPASTNPFRSSQVIRPNQLSAVPR